MNITLQGTVLLTLADTLAAHQLGGFKVGVGFALRNVWPPKVTCNIRYHSLP